MGPGGDGGGSFGTDFSGKGYGGGGIRMMDFGTDWTQGLIGRGFNPGNFGLAGESADYAPGGKYNLSNTNTSIPGGYGLTTDTPTGKSADHIGADEREVLTTQLDPMETFGKYAEMGMDPSFLDPSGIGSLSPTTPTPFQPETGIFGGTLGPKLKNAIPAGLREFLGNVAKIHPATMNAVLMGKLVKGWQSADDKGKFMRNVMKGLAMSKFMGSKGLGLSSAQRSLAGEGMNVLRGEQSMTQGIGNFATDAGINQLMRNVLPKAYEAQGMNGVYAAIAAIKMLGQRAKEGVSSLGGPGGGG